MRHVRFSINRLIHAWSDHRRTRFWGTGKSWRSFAELLFILMRSDPDWLNLIPRFRIPMWGEEVLVKYLSRVERPQHDSPRITYVHTMWSYSPQRRRWVVYTSSLDQGISYVFALEVRTWTVQFEKIVFRNFRTSYMFSHKTDNNCIDRDSDVTQRQAAIFPCVIENGNFPHLWSSIRHVEWV